MEELEKCGNCECKFPTENARVTDDDVTLCPECWTALKDEMVQETLQVSSHEEAEEAIEIRCAFEKDRTDWGDRDPRIEELKAELQEASSDNAVHEDLYRRIDHATGELH